MFCCDFINISVFLYFSFLLVLCLEVNKNKLYLLNYDSSLPVQGLMEAK